MKYTNSDFIECLITRNRNYSLVDCVKKDENLIKTEVDKLIYNTITNTNKYETKLTISNYSDNLTSSIFNKFPQGKTDCAYHEFIRAFNKLCYRFFNDGDDVVYGPYSAIQIYLHKTDGDRQFCFDGYDLFYITLTDCENDEIIDNINCLISAISFPNSGYCVDMIYKDSYKFLKWCDAFLFIVDQLSDDIKGLNKNIQFENCDNYYMNCMDYCDKDLYAFLCNYYNSCNWSCNNFERSCDEFIDNKENITVKQSYNNKYIISIYTHSGKIILDGYLEFNLDDIENETIQKFINWSNQENIDIDVEDYIKYGHYKKDIKYIIEDVDTKEIKDSDIYVQDLNIKKYINFKISNVINNTIYVKEQKKEENGSKS